MACAGLAALACGEDSQRDGDPPNQNARPEQGLVSGKPRLRNRISENCAGLRHEHPGASEQCARRRCRGRAPDPGRDTRLRAAVAFFEPIVVDAEWLRLKKEIAWLNISLGAARDSDVSMEYARRKRYQAWAEREIGDDLDRRRVQDHRRLLRCLRSSRFQRLIVAMADWVDGGPWLARWERQVRRNGARSLDGYCKRELNRWRERLIHKGRHLENLAASGRHRLRIRGKRFRYMLEALTETVGVRGRGELRHVHGPAKRLQRALGDLRDLTRFANLPVTKG